MPQVAYTNLNTTAEFSRSAPDAVDLVVTNEFWLADGKTATIRQASQLKSIVYNPDHESLKSFDWKPSVPEGFPVSVMDYQDDEYEWRNGALVRLAGPEPEKVVVVGKSWPAYATIGAVIVAVAAASFLWRRAARMRAAS